MNNKLVSIPYIYPLCPLNFNHAKMFVVADVLCRYLESKGSKVTFPVASHYSGNTAQETSESLTRVFGKKSNQKDKKVLQLHRDTYKIPTEILKTFTESKNLLNYYTQEIYWELRSLNTSSDFKHSYGTNYRDFPIFVNAIISSYEKKGLLVKNKSGELALDYDNNSWKKSTKMQIEKTYFNQLFHKQNVVSSMKNIRNDWGFLRTSGFGVTYKKKWIIDPMFDSELFTIFDLYMILKEDVESKHKNKKIFFEKLIQALENGKQTDDNLINKITSNLPCDVFVSEEHLKNWVVKKFYAETALLHPKYRTQKYMFMGMGLLYGKRMSASRGHAIFSKDLIEEYGSHVARLILLLSGGNISKTCNYDTTLPETSQRMIRNSNSYLTQLISHAQGDSKSADKKQKSDIESYSERMDFLIDSGNYRQVCTEVLKIIPSKNVNVDRMNDNLLSFYKKYLGIILPNYIDLFITK